MLRSIVTIALRNFRRQLTYSIINVTGLAIGIASALVILIYVFKELSYEKHFAGHERVYRVATKFMSMGEFANGPEVLFEEMPREYPWIEKTCRVEGSNTTTISVGEFNTKRVGLYVEKSFFEMFPYHFDQGHGQLKDNSIVLSRETAETLFGNGRALGNAIDLQQGQQEKRTYTVIGVVDLEGVQSHLNAPFWAAMPPVAEIQTAWFSIAKYNYMQVAEGKTLADVQLALDQIAETKIFPNLGSTLAFEDWYARDDAFRLMAQPLDEIYLKGTLQFDLTSGGNTTAVYSLAAIAALILMIAAVNFVNLSTARAIRRSKEVGMKKVMGSGRGLLILQFIGESVVVSTIALLFALGLAELLLLSVEKITGLEILTSIFAKPGNLLVAFFISMGLGLMAGVYPAFVLSNYKPIVVLKSVIPGQGGSSMFRNVLVVFQFSLSTILIISSIVIFKQVNFMRNRDLGFQPQNVLIIDNAHLLKENRFPFKQQILTRTGVISASVVNRVPTSSSSFSISTLESPALQEPLKVNRFQGDYDYITTLGFELVQGRTFRSNIASDSNAIVLNEQAVEALQLAQPVGAILNKKYEVVGVVRDFNFESMKKQIAPAMISPDFDGYQIAVRLEASHAADIAAFIEKAWNDLSMEGPIRFHYLDENIEEMMRNEKVIGRLVLVFTLLAIVISSLGLFGLSAYMASQRKKEVGIRKVLGASLADVVILFNRHYTLLTLISIVVAVPVSVYLMNGWLSGFAYRTSIGIGVIVATALVSLLISWLSVSYHTLMASSINPAETLKYE